MRALTSRQTGTGWAITALNAIDLAFWDLRGKAVGWPVRRLLGAERHRLNAYASMLGFSVKPAEAGTFAMAEEPGLGPSLDEARMERV